VLGGSVRFLACKEFLSTVKLMNSEFLQGVSYHLPALWMLEAFRKCRKLSLCNVRLDGMQRIAVHREQDR
jgi:hypothetical protein